MRHSEGGFLLDPPGPDVIRALSWTGWGGGPLHWGRTTITYSFVGPADRTPTQFAPSSSITSLDATQRAGFEAAIARWEAVAAIDFVPYSGSDPGQADIRIGFADFPAGSGLSAVTWVVPDMQDRIHRAEIWLNRADPGTADLSPGTFGNLAALHELGHALGLGHPFAGDATLPPELDHRGVTVMSYRDHPGTGRDAGNAGLEAEPLTPMPYDIAVVQNLYGANYTHATGDDVYRFADGMARIQTIWDAGGVDTIDAGDQRLPVIIDLRQGAYSSIGAAGSYGADRVRTAENNLAIAFGTEIENAVGGRGDDRLVGNELANRLEGGEGTDVITGGAGIDTLVGGRGADLFVDTPEGLDGDLLLDFAVEDRIEFLGVSLTDSQLVTGTAGGRSLLSVDLDADGISDLAVRFGTLLAGEFRVAGDAGAGAGAVVRLDLAPDTVDRPPGRDGIDWVGTAGADKKYGTRFDDVLVGGDGRDRLYGKDGDDLLEGGDGRDKLFGGRGDDVLRGGDGADRLYGQRGDDLLEGGDGRDRLYGKAGADRLYGGPGDDRLYGGSGDDFLHPGPGDDRIHGGRGRDVLRIEGDSDGYSLVRRGKVWILDDLRPEDGDTGRDHIKATEILQFDDLRLDISGKVAKVLDGGAGFEGSVPPSASLASLVQESDSPVVA